MFTAQEKALLVASLEREITASNMAAKKSRFPEMAPVAEKHISTLRSLIEKIRGLK